MEQRHPDGRTVVVSGGTDGMGRGIVLARLGRGDTVVVIGSGEAKGAALMADAALLGAAGRCHFVQVDLSSIAAVERVVEVIAREHPVVDALVLCANRLNRTRRESPEGLESTFSLYYLSRYLLGHGLRFQLDSADNPVIMNFAAPGLKVGSVKFDDLQAERRYGILRVQAQCGRANDLLGRNFLQSPSSRARYVLYHPGFTATRGGVAHLRQPARGIITVLGRVAARSVDQAIAPMVELIDRPPAERLTAIDRGKPVDLSLRTFDPDNARRLAEVSRSLVLTRYGPTQLLPEPGEPGEPGSAGGVH
ncbi:SDR family NAD(P)-dependent oxidoreductase [Frankia sp. R43]|uniref:SDR family NAD(P)-dependent oxidoreductase n=1 Tax=Frankia sp. R43 TaxID=269536 RepID=UPI0007C69995|nr:SDR family NAD(P)-dependent oxidoreductase [Frankia sp. R43]